MKKTLLESTARIPARPPQPDLEKTAMLDRTATVGRPAADPDAMGTTTRTLTGRGKGSVDLVRAWLDDQKHYGDLLELETVLCLPEGQAIEETRLRLKEKQKMARIWAEAQKADLQTLGRSALDKLRKLEDELSPLLQQGLPALVRDLQGKQRQSALRSFETQARALVTATVLKAHALQTLQEIARKAELSESDVEPVFLRMEEEGVAVGLPFSGQRLASRQEFIAGCRVEPEALERVLADPVQADDLGRRLQECLDVSGARRSVEQLRTAYPADPATAARVLLWRLGDRSLQLSAGVADDLASWVRGVQKGAFTAPSCEALRSGQLALWFAEGLHQPVLREVAENAAHRCNLGEDGEEALWHVVFCAEDILGPQEQDPRIARDAAARLVSRRPAFAEAAYRLAVAEASLGQRDAAATLMRKLAGSDPSVVARLREQVRSTRNDELRRSLQSVLEPLEQEHQVRPPEPPQPPKASGRGLALAAGLAVVALGGAATLYFLGSKGSLPGQGAPTSVPQEALATGPVAPTDPSAPVVPSTLSGATPSVERDSAPTQADSEAEKLKQQEAAATAAAAAARRSDEARNAVANEIQTIEALLGEGNLDAAGEKIGVTQARASSLPGGGGDELQKLAELQRGVQKALVSRELETERQKLHENDLKARIAEIEKLIDAGKLPEAQDRANGLIERSDVPEETRATARVLLERVGAEWKKRFDSAEVTTTTKKKSDLTKPK